MSHAPSLYLCKETKHNGLVDELKIQRLLLSQLFLYVLAIIPCFIVIAADRLIQIECHNAEVPTFCIECLKSDPRSAKANKAGIAVIILSSLSNNAKTVKTLAINMSEIASGIKDKNVTKVLKTCSKEFYSSTQDLASATLKLKSGRYGGAEHSVSRAVVYVAYCRHEIDGKVVPRDMIYEMLIYEELSEAANRS